MLLTILLCATLLDATLRGASLLGGTFGELVSCQQMLTCKQLGLLETMTVIKNLLFKSSFLLIQFMNRP